MKRSVKRIVVAVLWIICMATCSMNAFAADDRLGEVVDGSLLTDETEVQMSSYPLARGTFLNYGSASLLNNGNRNVTAGGQTVCYYTCDKVKVTIYLQRLEGTSWVTVKTLGPKVAYDNYFVSASSSYTVTGGYYYRVKSGHVAIDGGADETTTSFTNGIWID